MDVGKLVTLCKVSQESLKKVMVQFVKKYYTEVYEYNTSILAVGSDVGVVAHMDTVFPKVPQQVYYDEKKQVIWSPTGLGADDRAGVYAIIELVERGYRPTIILTCDEEKGGIGAYELVTALIKKGFPKQLKYLIELDRRGEKDSVFYDCDNAEFEQYVNQFGFETHIGSFSDISFLCPDFKCAGVNLSVGYYNEHTETEHLYLNYLQNTIDKVCMMLDEADKAPYFEYIEVQDWLWDYSGNFYGWDEKYGIGKNDWMSYMAPERLCTLCGHKKKEHYMAPIQVSKDAAIDVCAACLQDIENVYICDKCGEVFMGDEHQFCFKCREVQE